jgi:hypothetical protein
LEVRDMRAGMPSYSLLVSDTVAIDRAVTTRGYIVAAVVCGKVVAVDTTNAEKAIKAAAEFAALDKELKTK